MRRAGFEDAGTTPSPNFAYDTKGELTQITDPLGNNTNLTYTPVGLIATLKDAQNNVTAYTGGGQINAVQGHIFGNLNDDNSGYSGGFATVSGSGGALTSGLGGFVSTSIKNGLSFTPQDYVPDGNVTVVGMSVGASVFPGPTGGISTTNYTDPAQLPSWLSKIGVVLSPDDWKWMALRKWCKRFGGIK